MDIEELNKFCINSFVDHIGIRFTAFENKIIYAEIQIGKEHLQPVGVVHGGVYISLAETVAGAGSNLLIDPEKQVALGSTINSQHLSPTSTGTIKARAELCHETANKHIWDVRISDESDKLISISRVTNSIKEKGFPEKEIK